MAEQEQDHPQNDEIVKGGPGAEPETEQAPAETPPSPGPATEKVRIGGTEVELPSEVALALKKDHEEREAEFKRRFSEQGHELGELRKLIESRVPEPKEPEPESPRWGDKLFEDPDATVEEIVARAVEQAEQRAQKKYEELTQRQQLAARQEEFWNSFYRDNNELQRADDHWVVQAVMAEHSAELDQMPISQAKDRLAELTRSRILNFAKRGQSSNPARTVEAASPPSATTEADDEPQVHGSLTATLKAKRAARIAAKRAATGGAAV